MRILHRNDAQETEFDIRVSPAASPTFGDLLVAIGADPDRTYAVDGAVVDPTTGLSDAGLAEGSVIGPPHEPDSPAEMRIAVVGGTRAGRSIALGPRRQVVGRAADADLRLACPTVSAHHLAIDPCPGGVRVTDLDSRNGTLVDGEWVAGPTEVRPGQVLDLGASLLTLTATVDDSPLGLAQILGRTPSGTFPFNRPPRPATAPTTAAIDAPSHTTGSIPRAVFSWSSFLAPLAFGLVMAVFYNPLFALFALLSPVMVVANWIENRRRGTRERRQRGLTRRRAFEQLRVDAAAALRHEQRRRRAAHPDIAEVRRRAAEPSTRLWERRLDHADAFRLVLGTADVDWRPDLATADGGQLHPDVGIELAELGGLRSVPVPVELGAGEVAGIVGDPHTARRIARSLVVQAATHHGPADLAVVALSAGPGWGWASWLPHARSRGADGHRHTLAVGRDAIARLAAALRANDGDTTEGTRSPVTLVVVDGDDLTVGRTSAARAMLAGLTGPTAGIVVAPTVDRLPALCTTVVEVTDPDGLVRVSRPGSGEVIAEVLATGIDEAAARETARHLARYEDPELIVADASIPAEVSLLELLGVQIGADDAIPTTRIEARWRENRGTAALTAPIGADGHGIVELDLVRDGPHGLIGGTTGSGKSELLRSLVASLAATADAEHLNFVLIDYKGGSAFDRCAALPHTVGLVTDLDEHLGARALQCLEAELHRRERQLRDAGVDDIVDYRGHQADQPGAEPLPRLVVVIDEFATMAAELPDFIDALVGIAQRGRSLGVHLLLATQRPSGAVSANIRTNTNLRIALRVLDAGDSSDVIDVPDAARIGRDQPGRGFARLGPAEVVPFQSALVTGTTRRHETRPIEAVPLVDGSPVSRSAPAPASGADQTSDLDLLVAAIVDAHRRGGLAGPRRPWPEPLPAEIDLAALEQPVPTGRGVLGPVAIGLADHPDAQAQRAVHFDPALGNAIFLGIPGSGTTTALCATVLALTASNSPDELHVFGLDYGAGGLAPLAGLPHCGAVVGAAEHERQARLLRHLGDELARRRRVGHETGDEPALLLVVDNFGAFRSEYEDSRDFELVDQLRRLYTDGVAHGIHVLVSGEQANAVPRAMTAVTSQIWLGRFTDPSDYLNFGVRVGANPTMAPGRAFQSECGTEVQLARPAAELVEAVRTIALTTAIAERAPAGIGVLPLEVALDDLDTAATLNGSPVHLPVGMGDDALAAVGFDLHDGEHALVAGPARSGKSTTLLTIARFAREGGARIVALAGARSPLASCPFVDEVVADADALVDRLGNDPRRTVALVDDADRVEDPVGRLTGLLEATRPGLHVIAAGRADRLRAAYGHWTTPLRSARVGVLLSPDLLDGDLLGIQLPPRVQLPPLPGRGWLVGGAALQVCQVARCELPPTGDDSRAGASGAGELDVEPKQIVEPLPAHDEPRRRVANEHHRRP